MSDIRHTMEGNDDCFLLTHSEADALDATYYDMIDPSGLLQEDLCGSLSSSFIENYNGQEVVSDWSNLQLMFTNISPLSSWSSSHDPGVTALNQPYLIQSQDNGLVSANDATNNELFNTMSFSSWSAPNAITALNGEHEEPKSISKNIPEAPARMTKESLRTLKDWKTQHGDNARPTAEQIHHLQRQTNLSANQIQNWFTHTRRRNQAFGAVASYRQGGQPYVWSNELSTKSAVQKPPERPPTPASRDIIFTPPTALEDMCPMERWENSPPEHEAALFSDIAKAISHSNLPHDAPNSRGSTRSVSRASTGSSVNGRRFNPSESSIDSDMPGGSSKAWSDHSGHSTQSGRSGSEYRRRARKRRTNPLFHGSKSLRGDTPKMFQCTFCTDSFKTKYDWSRHEKSLHLALESWTCTPFGSVNRGDHQQQQPQLQPPSPPKCAFCNASSPTESHLQTHRHLACDGRPFSERTYYRKDHLRQHLRLVHGCNRFIPSMEKWKSTPEYLRSRCGFCDMQLTTWQERVDHLARHFRQGQSMANWAGGWGFEPHIAQLIENGMPPFLIHHERSTVAPFSGSMTLARTQRDVIINGNNNNNNNNLYDDDNNINNGDSSKSRSAEDEIHGKQLKLYCSQYTYPDTQEISWYECFESQLTTYINATLAEEGRMPSDKEIQDQGRRFVYDGDDPWHQTIADNAMWLTDFKERYAYVDTGSYVADTKAGQAMII